MKLVNFLVLCLLAAVIAGPLSADEPPTFSIKDIQQYNGVFEGDRVRVVGVTTHESARYGYAMTIISDLDGGAWGSIAVYDNNQRLVAERGNTVDVVGIVQEYYDFTELNITDETEFPPMVTGNAPLPPVIEVTCAQADQEQYESCTIMIRNAEVLSNPDPYGNIAINDGTAEFTLLLRSIDPAPPIGHVYDCLTGADYFSWGEFKIRPRDENDWVCNPGQPTATPSAPTPTPDPSQPTPTPDPAQPTPTPDPNVCDPQLTLYFNNHNPGDCFYGGDMFEANYELLNNCFNENVIDLYIALNVADIWFFWPGFTESVDKVRFSLRIEERIIDGILPAFSWPEGTGALDGLAFWGLMTEPDTFNVVCDIQTLEFCYR